MSARDRSQLVAVLEDSPDAKRVREWQKRDRAAIRLDPRLDYSNADDFQNCFFGQLVELYLASGRADSLSETAVRLVEMSRQRLPADSTLDPQQMVLRDIESVARDIYQLYALVRLVTGRNMN